MVLKWPKDVVDEPAVKCVTRQAYHPKVSGARRGKFALMQTDCEASLSITVETGVTQGRKGG